MSDNRAPMAAAILTAIVETNMADDGSIDIDPAHVEEAIMIALAAMIEGRPDIRTPDDVRRSAEAFSLALMDKVAEMRAAYERTEKRLWNGGVLRLN